MSFKEYLEETANSDFKAGLEAAKAGKSEDDNPYINGKTKLGNPKLSDPEKGEEWWNGFRSVKQRHASKKELEDAAKVDVSRFRKKSKKYYRS